MRQIVSPSEPNQQPLAASSGDQRATEPDATSAETIVLDVEGMMCAGCVSTVEKKLAQCDGVASATVNLVTEVAAVQGLPTLNPQKLAQALSEAGYPSRVRSRQGTSVGSEVGSDLAAQTDWLARKENEQKNQSVQIAVAGCLLLLSTLGHLQHLRLVEGSQLQAWLSLPIISTLWFHGVLATLTLLFPARKILIEGFQGARRGAPNMNTLVTLGALSAYLTSLAALFFPQLGWECFFDEPVMLLSFILIGRTLERRARYQAASSLRSLIALQPAQARLTAAPTDTSHSRTATTEDVLIPADQVKVGEWLRVLPGEKIPVDGTIALGETTLNESMLTGESVPVVKASGDEVSAGTFNQSGMIVLQVSRTGTGTTLGQMIQLVETAQTRKAPIQGLADLISGYFTYGVLACAVLTFCFWYYVGTPLWPDIAQSALGHVHHGAGSAVAPHAVDQMMSEMGTAGTGIGSSGLTASLRLLVSLKLAIAVIVVACPCALGLATPTAILVGSGIGAEQGLLIRGGDILEATRGLDTLVFDKTGTLTTGIPYVTDCQPLVETISADWLLTAAATVEKGTQHPLAVAIQQAASDRALSTLSAEKFYTQAGAGVRATLTYPDAPQPERQIEICVGNLAWIKANGAQVEQPALSAAEALAQNGRTVVFVTSNQQLIGLIGIADTLRPEAAQTIQQLQQMGLAVQILSGDHPSAVSAIAEQLHLSPSQVQAEVSPAGKVAAIRQLQTAGKLVGLIGDGINDAPALAQADVGIALNSGTEIAMETADIVLVKDTLTEVPAAIRLSRNTFNKIRQNLTWAFAYNLICIPLAAGALLPGFGLSLNPGFAGGLMALSSVTVVLNSLLLRLSHNR